MTTAEKLIVKGRSEGKREGKRDVARNMMRKGVDITLISEVTGLSEDEINLLIKN
jgi:predicted transposase/invertase (TIGR01784 family)